MNLSPQPEKWDRKLPISTSMFTHLILMEAAQYGSPFDTRFARFRSFFQERNLRSPNWFEEPTQKAMPMTAAAKQVRAGKA